MVGTRRHRAGSARAGVRLSRDDGADEASDFAQRDEPWKARRTRDCAIHANRAVNEGCLGVCVSALRFEAHVASSFGCSADAFVPI